MSVTEEDGLDVEDVAEGLDETSTPEVADDTSEIPTSSNAAQIAVDSMAAKLDKVSGLGDQVRQLFITTETIRQVFGDKEEILARAMDEVEQIIVLICAELNQKPSRGASRIICTMDEGADRDAAIAEFMTTGLVLTSLVQSQQVREQIALAIAETNIITGG